MVGVWIVLVWIGLGFFGHRWVGLVWVEIGHLGWREVMVEVGFRRKCCGAGSTRAWF